MSETKRWYVNDIRASKMRELGWEGPCIDQILILDKPPSEAVSDEGRNCVVARISYEGRSGELCDEHLADAHMLAASPAMAEALEDMLAGWKYIRMHHGDLFGVGWDRAQSKAEAALALARGEPS